MNDIPKDPLAAADGAWARPRPLLRAIDGEALPASPFSARPYTWVPPAQIPPREPLYGQHLFRGYVSGTAAAGGSGKSSLIIAETMAKVSGKRLFGKYTPRPLRCWLWNLEDPHDEMVRRIQATALRHNIQPADIADRLFLNNGRETPLIIATKDGDTITINEPIVDALVSEIQRLEIDSITIDPFVSSHALPENDNAAIDRAIKTWGMVAERGRCGVELVHHIRKTGGEEVTAESARGAKSFVDGCRSVRVINRMTEAEGAEAGVKQHRAYFRVQADKVNLSPPEDADWYHIESVELGNGDNIGVVVPWKWPDAFDGISAHHLMAVQRAIDGKGYRQNVQAADWIGHAIAGVVGVDPDDPAAKATLKTLIKEWIKSGALVVVDGKDAKGNSRPIVEVGRWAT